MMNLNKNQMQSVEEKFEGGGEKVGTKRIGGLVAKLIEVKKMRQEYELRAFDLLTWINHKIVELNDRKFAGKDVEELLRELNKFSVSEKLEKINATTNLELFFSSIQISLRSLGMRCYQPTNGLSPTDIRCAWNLLRSTQNTRAKVLKLQLERQRTLESLATKFNKMAFIREKWLCESQKIASRYPVLHSLDDVKTHLQKHKALLIEVNSFPERIEVLRQIGGELWRSDYYDVEKIWNRMKNLHRMWHYLLELLNIRSTKLSIAEQVFQAAQESLETMKLMEELTEKSSETSYPHPIENRERSRELCESDIIFYEGLVKQHSEALFSFINGRTIVDSEAIAEDCDISSVIEVSGWRPISQTQLENIVKRLQLSLTCLKNQMKLKMTYENETFHVMKRVPLKLTEQSEKQFISKSIGNKFRKHVDRLRNCFIKSPSSDICKKVEIVEYEKISSIHNFSNKPTNGPETGNVLNNFRRRAMKKLGLKRNSIKKPSFPKQNKNERAELK